MARKPALPRMGEESGGLTVLVDGRPIQAMPGETVAAALYAAGIRAWRTSRSGEQRGLLCGMGVCFDCLLTVDGAPDARACQVIVREGMRITTNPEWQGEEQERDAGR